MSDLRPVGIPINLGGEERHLLFTLNAMDTLESDYDKPIEEIINQLTDKKTSWRTLKKILTVIMNDSLEREGKEPVITEHDVGWWVHGGNILEVSIAVMKAYGYSLPEPDEFESPNGETGQ